MSNNKQSMKLYTEEQLLNTIEAIRDYLKNYPEKFNESMIEKHLKNLAPIELPSDEEVGEFINTFPYTKHLDDGQFNDGVIYGATIGIDWMRNKIQGGKNEQPMIDYNAMEEESEMDNYNEMKDEQQ